MKKYPHSGLLLIFFALLLTPVPSHANTGIIIKTYKEKTIETMCWLIGRTSMRPDHAYQMVISEWFPISIAGDPNSTPTRIQNNVIFMHTRKNKYTFLENATKDKTIIMSVLKGVTKRCPDALNPVHRHKLENEIKAFEQNLK